MDWLLVSVIVVAAGVVALFLKWLLSEPDASQAGGERERVDNSEILTELERIRQKPPGPVA